MSEIRQEVCRIVSEVPTQANGHRHVVVPRVQSMKAYILQHCKPMIFVALNEWFAGQRQSGRKGTAWDSIFINGANAAIASMTFWRCNAYTLLTDVIVQVRAQEGVQMLYCELFADMRQRTSFYCGECGSAEALPERQGWMLSEYLVPMLRKDEIEAGAEDLLLRYCPEAIRNRREHGAELLASRMGLQVMRLPLHKKARTRSSLFFRSGYVIAAENSSDGQAAESTYAVYIPANTIVINTNAAHRDQCQMEIYHECIHYDWHYMFFRLQDMHNSDVNTLRRRHVVVMEEKTPKNPLRWMEWQARRGSYGLMMPLGLMEPIVSRLNREMARSRLHAGAKFDRIARAIAAERELPKFRVRARLIQMGHTAAKGALNYVDGAYIKPFAFSPDCGRGNYTFVIDRKSAFTLYQTDEAFRERIRSGEYVYVDGHICQNDSRYVQQSASGARLTAWANAHVDECCLRFIQVYEPSGMADYCLGELNSDEEYNRHYLTYVQCSGELSEKETLLGMTRLLDALPGSFHGALTFLMKEARITIEELEERAFLSGRTISRLRTQERSEYSLDQVIALCVALHLPPWLSREMLQRAGFVLRSIRQHQAYQLVLDCLFMDSVEDVQRFLEASGCQKLRLSGGA